MFFSFLPLRSWVLANSRSCLDMIAGCFIAKRIVKSFVLISSLKVKSFEHLGLVFA